MNFKKLLLLIFILFTIFLVSIKNMASFAIHSFFASKNIRIEFEIESFHLKAIEFKNLLIEEKIKIPLVKLMFEWSPLPKVVAVKIEIANLDSASLLDLHEKISPQNSEPDKSPIPSFSNLQILCRTIEPIDIDVALDHIQLENLSLPLQLRGTHKPSKAATTFTWNDLKSTNGEISINCEPQEITFALKSFEIHIKDLIWKKPETHVHSLKTQFASGEFKMDSSNTISSSLIGFLYSSFTQKGVRKNFEIQRMALNGTINPQDLKNSDFKLQLEHLQLNVGNRIQLARFAVSPNGHFSINDISIEDEKEKTLAKNISVDGQFFFENKPMTGHFKVKDATHSLEFDDLRTTIDNDKNLYSLIIVKNRNHLKLQNATMEAFPPLKQFTKTLSGKIELHGQIQMTNDQWEGHLSFVGKNIDSQSEFGDFSGVEFRHDITSLQTFSSSPNQHLHIKTAHAGIEISDIHLDYQVKNKSKVDISDFNMKFNGADIVAKNFFILTELKRIENFEATIQHIDLQKVLAIGLKNTVTASGTLSGNLGVTFHGKRPILHGQLMADQTTGWIQYRHGNTQQKGIHLSDSPMDILNNYLYDFQYQSLSINIKTDDKYDMDMALSTLGRNPEYLDGKPLRLNIKLEQNLLAALQSMMLTYDLPNKIKEQLEKAE